MQIVRFRVSSCEIRIVVGTTLKILYFVLEKTNGRLGSTFGILYFIVKTWTAVWLQLTKFCVSLQQNEWLFGYNCKILYFAVKKRVVVWVHALLISNQWKLYFCYSYNIDFS